MFNRIALVYLILVLIILGSCFYKFSHVTGSANFAETEHSAIALIIVLTIVSIIVDAFVKVEQRSRITVTYFPDARPDLTEEQKTERLQKMSNEIKDVIGGGATVPAGYSYEGYTFTQEELDESYARFQAKRKQLEEDFQNAS